VALANAGILQASEQRRPGAALTSNGYIEYRLVINSGRKNPVWRERFKEVYDPNTNITYSINNKKTANQMLTSEVADA
jgi:uncharacterized membrane protein